MVEWKKLGEVEAQGVLSLGRGQIISKLDMQNCPGDFPVYSSSSQGNGEIGRYGRYMFDDERITWSIDGGGRLFYRNNEKYSVTNVCGWLKVNKPEVLSTRFLYFSLYDQWSNITFDYNHKAHPSVIRNEYLIPLPSLSEQERIVGILDTFTSSIENLKAQISLRRKQYEHYRDKLLDLEGKQKKIGELTTIFSCPRVYREQWQNHGVPFWRSSDVMSFHNGQKNPRGEAFISQELYEELSQKSNKIEEGDLLVTGGGSIGIPYLKKDNKPLFVKDADLICIKKCECLIPAFLYHYFLSTEFKLYLKKITHDATIAHYTIGQITDTPIPLPSLQEQSRIVSILDEFEASIKNLEAQLEAREKQYEYYRNKLLTFE